MANGYTTIIDILRNPLAVRRERYGTTELSHIVIDGQKFGGYKTFSSFWEKTYPEQPERSTGGVLGNLNSYSTFVTFHVRINFAMMSIADYRRLYDLMLDRNEFTVTAYNIRTNQPYTCKMYFAPDQMPNIYAVSRKLQGTEEKFIEVLGVQDYTIELIGTNESMDKVEIRYYDENDNLIPNSVKSVNKGVETIVNYNYTPTSGYRFDGKWQKNDIEGNVVYNGSLITPTENVKLKAIVVPTTQYTLSLDYGIGIKPIPQSSEQQIDSFPISAGDGTTVGSAILNANVTLNDGTLFSFPSLGTGIEKVEYEGSEYNAYTFKGWYWTTEENTSARVLSSSEYNYNMNRTIHQIYAPKRFTISFNTNVPTVSISSMTFKYGENITLPTLDIIGKRFLGWFFTINGTEKQLANGTAMPPLDINLYAKWE